MKLQRRGQADDAFWDQSTGLGQGMTGVDWRVGELIESPGGADDRFLVDQAGQRLRANALGDEVFEPQHAPGFQQLKSAISLGVRCRHGVTFPLQVAL